PYYRQEYARLFNFSKINNRQLRTNINLNHMKDIQESVESVKKGAISLGLNLGQLKADIDPKSLRANSAILSLHNDKVPVRRMGLGSKRIIAIGSQLQCIKDGAVLLIDEVEQALEPHRTKYLIRKLIEQAHTANGQIIMTTHSPAVLEELGAKPLFIVRNENLITTVTKVNPEAQGTVRSVPDAFLSPRVIVCEGATEVGILRSFENNILSPTNISYALKKVNIVDGKGTDATKRAKHLKDHGYDVCLFIDSDKVSEWLVAEDELLRAGIKVIRWDDSICTENRIIHDVPDKNSLKEIVEVAMTATGKTKESLISSINSKLSQNKLTDINHIATFTDETSLRNAIYDASVIDDKEWFKTVSRGELLGNYIFQKVYTQMQTTDFYKKLEELKGWVIG
ncbi:MAG TPA: AAA family ATPase, partial [Anaerohalosphaeraceae bacterium]|nr:AAA family ATPase [Anaerohalosphaeraceae bacterium]HQG07074.1 AAA family ATPase [Anaerohalosphaeraceae bacterium]HQI08681.1 AAA family ATPase [Anaerohalosphaeraceae bacterium]HQJ69009.1 AAA family ATPase [Anaerohalosphaeraceae bacterium]